jgi:pilus assembly protein CpaE
MNSFRILVVCKDPGEFEAVSQKLSETDGGPSFTVGHADSLMKALDRLAREQTEAILLDISLPDIPGLEALGRMREAAPGVPVLIWAASESEQLAQAAVRAGAEDFLVRDRLGGAALKRALHYAIMRSGNKAPSPAPRAESAILGVLGAKGGVGTTTLVCHLSVELRRLTRQEVLLADFDLFAGQVAFMMHVNSAHSVVDAAQSVQRMDREYWNRLISRTADGVHIIQSPALASAQEVPAPLHFRQVFRFVRPYYPWTLIDLGRFNGMSAELLPEVDGLMLVTTGDIQSLLEAKRLIPRLPDAGCPREKIRVVLNRSSARSSASAAEVEKILGLPVYASLPNTFGPLSDACAKGQLLAEGTALRQRLASMVREMAGLEQPDQQASEKPKNILMRCLLGVNPFREASNANGVSTAP